MDVPLAYYQCEETVAPALDLVAGYNLSTQFGAIASVPGKIGKAFNMGTWGGRTVSTARFNFYQHAFSLRCWINPDFGFNFPTGNYNATIVLSQSWGLSWLGAIPGIHWEVVDDLGASVAVESGPIASGWHRVVCWWEPGVGVGLKIDNGPSLHTASTRTGLLDLGDGPLTFPETGGAPAPGQSLDEVVVWDIVLTEEDMLFDWNGGAGRTYPRLLPMNCNANSLLEAAKCYRCIPPGMQNSVATNLLCQWANASVEPAPCQSDVVEEWVVRVGLAGGTAPTAEIYDALCKFVNGLVTDGIYNKMVAVNCLVPGATSPATTPQELIRAMVPIIQGEGSNLWTNTGPFVAGDLSAQGLQGNNVNYLRTGVVPQTSAKISDTTMGVTVCITGATNEGNEFDFGAADGGPEQLLLTTTQSATNLSFFDCWSGAAGAGRCISVAANANWVGFLSGNRISATDSKIFRASSTVLFSTFATLGATDKTHAINVDCWFFCANSSGAPTARTSRRYSFFAIHQGLTPAEAQAFFNRIYTLRNALGGGAP